MSMSKEIEFNNIVSDILKNEEFIMLKYEIHHGITRLDHSLNVAHLSYKIAKRINIKNYEEIVRASLLHDFFKNSDVPNKRFFKHPIFALKNAKKYFKISKQQENIIIAHMFPLSPICPNNIGSWIVTFSDKVAAIKEMIMYKIPLTIGSIGLFFVNYISIQRKLLNKND